MAVEVDAAMIRVIKAAEDYADHLDALAYECDRYNQTEAARSNRADRQEILDAVQDVRTSTRLEPS